MASYTIELTDDEARQLDASASGRGMATEALIERWLRERLAHERERAAGGGKAMSPRARREQDQAGER